MRGKFLTAMLLSAGLLAPAATAGAGDHDFTLVNQTAMSIDKLFVVPPQANTWDEDLLKRDLLMPGEQAKIAFNRANDQCRWDLVVVDSTGTEVTWEDVDLCKGSKVLLRLEDDLPVAYHE